MLGEDQAVALAEAIQRLRVVRLERHLAEQVELVGLPDVLAGEVQDAFPQVGLGRVQRPEVGADLGLGELVERLAGRGHLRARGDGRAQDQGGAGEIMTVTAFHGGR